MDRLRIGTAGVPHSAKKRDSISGIKRIHELGLDAMELEFVRGVKMKASVAEEVRRIADEYDVRLTVHAPYYVNLASEEKNKREASIKRVVDSAEVGQLCGAVSVTFHAGYYGKNPQAAGELIREGILQVLEQLSGCYITISPETTGKPSQYGTLEELLNISRELRVGLCVDFSHLYARSLGAINGKDAFRKVIKQVKKVLGPRVVKNMHIHVSGMEFSSKGEVRHLNFRESSFDYVGLVDALVEEKVTGIVIIESPNLEEDALLFKDLYTKFSGGRV